MHDEELTGPAIRIEDVALLAAVALLPWAFGGVEQWAFRSAAFLIALAAGLALAREGWGGWGLDRGALWLIPAFGLLAWALIQVTPLPNGILARLSPAAHDVYATSLMTAAEPAEGVERLERMALEAVPESIDHPAAPQADNRPVVSASPDCLGPGRRTISLQPGATTERAAWFGALLMAFLTIRVRVRDPRRLQVYLATFAVIFIGLALVGLIQSRTWDGRLLWIRWIPSNRTPFGPYVNQVHFAGVMELAVPALVGFAWARFRRVGRAAIAEAPFVISAVGALTCLVAALAASSKAAVGLIGISILVLGLVATRNTKARLGFLSAALVVAIVVGLVASGAGIGDRLNSFVERAGQGHAMEGRGAVWSAMLSIVGDYPLTGIGFGVFPELHPRYLPLGAEERWNKVHNDYIEVLIAGGAIAAVLTLLLIVGYVWQLGGQLRAGRWGPARLGIALGVASLAGHAFFDFNHQIPANALLFVAMAALAIEGGLLEEIV